MIPSVEQIRAEESAKVKVWQKESFPLDPVLLYRLEATDIAGGSRGVLFAIPKDGLKNLDTVQEAVFFDVIQGDTVVETAFFGFSLVVTKVVFSSFEEVQPFPSLTVVDVNSDVQGVRASRVLLGLTGVKK